MFGLGFTEILLIAVVALLFIGPDKLPDTMKNIARTLGKIKRAIDDTKQTLEQELRVDELRAEVMQYRAELEKAKSDLNSFKNIANKQAESLKEVINIENSRYKPTDINDDKFLNDLFEEDEESDFDETKKVLKNNKEIKKKKEVSDNNFKNIPKQNNKQSNSKTASGFKHLDKKDT